MLLKVLNGLIKNEFSQPQPSFRSASLSLVSSDKERSAHCQRRKND